MPPADHLVVAFDPGIDDLGWSRFRTLPRGLVDPRAIRQSYVASGLERVSEPGERTVARLAQLADVARTVILSGGGAARVVIEQPARAGTYRRHLPEQRTQQSVVGAGMVLLYLAVGTLVHLSLSLGCATELVSASKSKLARLQIITAYWPVFRTRVYARGKHAGEPRPDDETDAVYLGLQAAQP